jgi:hypothetical protein
MACLSNIGKLTILYIGEPVFVSEKNNILRIEVTKTTLLMLTDDKKLTLFSTGATRKTTLINIKSIMTNYDFIFYVNLDNTCFILNCNTWKTTKLDMDGSDIVKSCKTEDTFAILTKSGKVFMYGNKTSRVYQSSLDSTKKVFLRGDIVQMVCTQEAVVVVNVHGDIMGYGVDMDEIYNLNQDQKFGQVCNIVSNCGAVTISFQNGSVVTVGATSCGADYPFVRKNVTNITSTAYGFSCKNAQNESEHWGSHSCEQLFYLPEDDSKF